MDCDCEQTYVCVAKNHIFWRLSASLLAPTLHCRTPRLDHDAESARRTALSYRTFTDSSGRRWEVWLVTPAAAERRKVDRRVNRAEADTPGGLADRRHTPDRRRSPFRRHVVVATEYSDGWLCFESEGEKRRLAPVPPEWEQAGPDRLSTWLQAAKRVVKCGP